jgi:hypothetical protein
VRWAETGDLIRGRGRVHRVTVSIVYVERGRSQKCDAARSQWEEQRVGTTMLQKWQANTFPTNAVLDYIRGNGNKHTIRYRHKLHII